MNQTVLDAKKALVSEISQRFSEAQSTVVVEYRGLSVAQMTTLRRKLRDEGVDMKIYKNKMASRAAEAAGYDDLSADLTGPNAFVFGNDAVSPSRILAEFAKKNKALVLKSGIVEGKVVTVDMIKELATLPNREGMISMLLGLFQAPVRNFAYALAQVAEQKDAAPVEEKTEEAPSVTEEVKEEAAPVAQEAKEEVKEEAATVAQEVKEEAKEENKTEDQ